MCFPTASSVRQGCLLSPLLFNSVVDEIMKRTLDGLQTSGFCILTGEKLVEFEYKDHTMLLFEDLSRLGMV